MTIERIAVTVLGQERSPQPPRYEADSGFNLPPIAVTQIKWKKTIIRVEISRNTYRWSKKYTLKHFVLMKVNVNLQMKPIRTRQLHQLRGFNFKNPIFKGRRKQVSISKIVSDCLSKNISILGILGLVCLNPIGQSTCIKSLSTTGAHDYHAHFRERTFGAEGLTPLDFEIWHFPIHFFVQNCYSVSFEMVKWNFTMVGPTEEDLRTPMVEQKREMPWYVLARCWGWYWRN